MQGTVKQQEKSRDQLAIETLKLLEENRLLKAQVQQLESQFKDRVVDYEKQLQGYEALIKLYEEAERLAKIQKFAASSEKSKFQFDVFDEAELEQALSDLEDQIDTEEAQQENRPARKKSRKKRTGFSPDLPRVRVELTLSDEEKAGATNTFFSRVKEELDIIPAQAQIIEYWQEKAVFGDEIGENTIVSAKRPVHPLGKSIASIALLAYVIVSKYADALPLVRPENCRHFLW